MMGAATQDVMMSQRGSESTDSRREKEVPGDAFADIFQSMPEMTKQDQSGRSKEGAEKATAKTEALSVDETNEATESVEESSAVDSVVSEIAETDNSRTSGDDGSGLEQLLRLKKVMAQLERAAESVELAAAEGGALVSGENGGAPGMTPQKKGLENKGSAAGNTQQTTGVDPEKTVVSKVAGAAGADPVSAGSLSESTGKDVSEGLAAHLKQMSSGQVEESEWANALTVETTEADVDLSEMDIQTSMDVEQVAQRLTEMISTGGEMNRKSGGSSNTALEADAVEGAHAPSNVSGTSHASSVSSTSTSTAATTPMLEQEAKYKALVDSVDRRLVSMAQRDEGSMRLTINSGDLGRLTLACRTEGSVLQVQIQTANPEVQELLQRHEGVVRALLQQHGANLGQFEVTPDSSGNEDFARSDAQGNDGEDEDGNASGSKSLFMHGTSPASEVEEEVLVQSRSRRGTVSFMA